MEDDGQKLKAEVITKKMDKEGPNKWVGVEPPDLMLYCKYWCYSCLSHQLLKACCQLASVKVWCPRTVSLHLSILHTKQMVCKVNLSESGCDLCWNQAAGPWPELLFCPLSLSLPSRMLFLMCKRFQKLLWFTVRGEGKMRWKDRNKMFYDQCLV